jgi:hypothetical protein
MTIFANARLKYCKKVVDWGGRPLIIEDDESRTPDLLRARQAFYR